MTDPTEAGTSSRVTRLPLVALIAAVVFWPAGLLLALVSLRRHPNDRPLAYAALGVSTLLALATVALVGVMVLAVQATSGRTDADSVAALRAVRGDLSVAVEVYETALEQNPSLAETGVADMNDLSGLRFSRFTERYSLAVEQRDDGSYCMEAATTERYGSRLQHYDSADDRYHGGSCAEPTALTP